MPNKSPFAPLEHMIEWGDPRMLTREEMQAILDARKELCAALKGALALLETDGSRHNIWHRALDIARGEKPDADR